MWVLYPYGVIRDLLLYYFFMILRSDYYPFGTRTGSYEETGGADGRWRFSGKEWQAEPAGLPLLDFGARMYDPATASWLSQGPMAEKYPFLSPYSYCAGDPVNLVDEEGRRIRVVGNENFRKAYAEARSMLAEAGVDESFVRIENDPNVELLVEQNVLWNNTQLWNHESILYWNPYRMTYNKWTKKWRSSVVILAHDMEHAVRAIYDPVGFKKDKRTKIDNGYDTIEERRVITGIEQKVAKALGEINEGEVTRRSHKTHRDRVEPSLSPKNQSSKAALLNNRLTRIENEFDERAHTDM